MRKNWQHIIFFKKDPLNIENFILDATDASNLCLGYKKEEGPQSLGLKRQKGRRHAIED